MTAEIQKNESSLKRRFAKLVVEHGDPFIAADMMYPSNVNRRLYVAMKWPEDPIVIEAMSSELDDIDNNVGKAKFARFLWGRLEHCEDAYVKPIGELYSKLMGFTSDGDNIDNRRTFNVMVMPSEKTESEFAKGCLAQQRNLLIESSNEN